MLRENKSNKPVRTALQSLDNIYVVGCMDEWKILEITKRNRNLMETFDVYQPGKRISLKDRTYISKSMIDETY